MQALPCASWRLGSGHGMACAWGNGGVMLLGCAGGGGRGWVGLAAEHAGDAGRAAGESTRPPPRPPPPPAAALLQLSFSLLTRSHFSLFPFDLLMLTFLTLSLPPCPPPHALSPSLSPPFSDCNHSAYQITAPPPHPTPPHPHHPPPVYKRCVNEKKILYECMFICLHACI